MVQGAHIAIIVITVLTLAVSVALLLVALKIQKDVTDKLDKAEQVFMDVRDKIPEIAKRIPEVAKRIPEVAKQMPGAMEPLKKFFNSIKL